MGDYQILLRLTSRKTTIKNVKAWDAVDAIQFAESLVPQSTALGVCPTIRQLSERLRKEKNVIHLALLVASALFLLFVAFTGLVTVVGVACRIGEYFKWHCRPTRAVLWAAAGMGLLAVVFHWLGLS